MPLRRVLCALLVLLSSAPAVSAQLVGGSWEQRHRFDGVDPLGQLGAAVAGVGDVDGDGTPDFLMGVPEASPPGLDYAGAAIVCSGSTAGVLLRVDGTQSFAHLGHAVAGAGDVDGDGKDDLILGAFGTDGLGLTDAGSAVVVSGASGATLFTFEGSAAYDWLGWSVAGAGDIDGDGTPDLLVGIPRADGLGGTFDDCGAAEILSGFDGSVLFRFEGAAAGDELGFAVASAGDVNGDGTPDVILATPGADPGGRLEAGAAEVRSGADGSLLWLLEGETAGDRLGAVDGAGDVNGDGFADLVTGAGLADSNGKGDSGLARVWSGADGSVLYRLTGERTGDRFGAAVSGAGDVDGDGADDVVAGARRNDEAGPEAGAFYVYSGASGELMRKTPAIGPGGRLGAAVDAAGDVDGDGNADVLAGAPRVPTAAGFEAGTCVVAGLHPWLELDGTELSASSGLPLTASVDFPASEGGRPYRLLASGKGTGPIHVGPVAIPMSVDRIFNYLAGGNIPPNVPAAHGVLDANGDATIVLESQPFLSRYVGAHLYLTVVSTQGGGSIPRAATYARSFDIVN